MPWPMHDVLDKVGGTGILGAASAFLASVALFCGIARIRLKDLPGKFPRDPEAAQAKYELAFRQLEEAVGRSRNGDGDGEDEAAAELVSALKGHTAAQLSLTAFLEATNKQGSGKKGERP